MAATMIGRPRLVLASASPRRTDLLRQAGIVPDRIVPPRVDETPARGERPGEYALRMAAAKALFVVGDVEDGSLVLAADTVVAVGRRILPKAGTNEEIADCLGFLSGRRHMVHTALTIARKHAPVRTRLVTTRVTFKRLSDDEIAAYLASGEGVGKAGGYAIQGRAEGFVRRINGSYSNVVGLPLYETLTLLIGCGYRPG